MIYLATTPYLNFVIKIKMHTDSFIDKAYLSFRFRYAIYIIICNQFPKTQILLNSGTLITCVCVKDEGNQYLHEMYRGVNFRLLASLWAEEL